MSDSTEYKNSFQARQVKFDEKHSNRGIGLDTDVDSAYDGGKKGKKQEVNLYGQDGKAEDHASFIRRMHEGSRKIKQIGDITYAFHALRVLDASNAAAEARQELRRLGIKCFLHNGLEYNQNGYTYQDIGVAATLADGSVGLYGKSYGDGIEYAGHEAFHVWKNSAEREAYVETLRSNISIASSVYGIEQADTALREAKLETIGAQKDSAIWDTEYRRLLKAYDKAVKSGTASTTAVWSRRSSACLGPCRYITGENAALYK